MTTRSMKTISKTLPTSQKTILSSQKYENALSQHQGFITKFMRFPNHTRIATYVELLQLPKNYEHYNELAKAYVALPQHGDNKQLHLIVGSLIKLSPNLKVQWVPGLIFPICRLFEKDSIGAFQTSLTLLNNHFKPLFSDYPHPSRSVMVLFSKYLHNIETKMNQWEYPLSALVHPSLLVGLTDIFNKTDYLAILDFLIAHPYEPSLYLCVLLQVILQVEPQLCRADSVEQACILLKSQKNLNIRELLNGALRLAEKESAMLQKLYNPQKCVYPLPKGRYFDPNLIKKTSLMTTSVGSSIQPASSESELNEIALREQFRQLEQQIKTKLQPSLVSHSSDINARYAAIQGQMQQYLRKIQQQHQQRLQAVLKLEEQHKQLSVGIQVLAEQNYSKKMDAIDRRGRLEKQILETRKQAQRVREVQIHTMNKLKAISEEQKNQLKTRNTELKKEQQLIKKKK